MSTRRSRISDYIPTNGTFEERLRWVIDGRPVNAWFAHLQIADGTRARMLKDGGALPAADTLVRIMHTEGVSVSWLLGARVSPFLLNVSATDAETAEILDAHLADEPWSLALFTDGIDSAWLLHQPGVIETGKAGISYRITSLIVGPSGAATFVVLARHGHAVLQHVQQVPTATIDAIVRGRVGTWRFFGDGKTPGLWDPAAAQTGVTMHDVQPGFASRIAERLPSAYAALPAPAQAIAQAWQSLPNDKRNALQLVVDGLVTPSVSPEPR